MSKNHVLKIVNQTVASEAMQTSLCLTRLQISEDRFSHDGLQLISSP